MAPLALRHRHPGWIVLLLVLPLSGQELRKALSHGEVLHLIENGVTAERVGKLAGQYRLGFKMTKEEEQQLTTAGASGELIARLREFVVPDPAQAPAPAAAAPRAELVVQSATPSVDVYVNDIRVGRAGPDGTLKIPDLDPGPQHIEVSREGFSEFNSDVNLVPGDATSLTVPPLADSKETPEALAAAITETKPAAQQPKLELSAPISAPFTVRDGFHMVGIPTLKRNNRCHLSITTRYVFFSTNSRNAFYKIPIDRVERVQMIAAERVYAKATYAAVLAFGIPGALMLTKKRKVDALVIDYRNERGGAMRVVVQVPKGMGTPCLERLAFGGIAIGPART